MCICMGSAENTFLKLLPELYLLCDMQSAGQEHCCRIRTGSVFLCFSKHYLFLGKCFSAVEACEMPFLNVSAKAA